MPVDVRAIVTGDRELESRLDGLARGRYIARALERSAQQVAKVARETRFRQGGGDPVPGILTERTGALKGAIRTRGERSHRARSAGGGSAGFWDVLYGAGGRHGVFHEYGTRRLPKRPVLTPALETASTDFPGIFLAEITEELRGLGLL